MSDVIFFIYVNSKVIKKKETSLYTEISSRGIRVWYQPLQTFENMNFFVV